MRILELKTFLEQNFPYTYYPNQFPPKKGDMAFVKLTGGDNDTNINGLYTPSFQVMVRATDPQTAEAKATEIHTALNGKEFFNIGSVYVPFCMADQPFPLWIGEDENGNTLYSINFTCKVRG